MVVTPPVAPAKMPDDGRCHGRRLHAGPVTACREADGSAILLWHDKYPGVLLRIDPVGLINLHSQGEYPVHIKWWMAW